MFLDLHVASCRVEFGCDGDQHLQDPAAFVECRFGPGVPPTPELPILPEQCIETFDQDGDQDVDAADFEAFQRAFTGP